MKDLNFHALHYVKGSSKVALLNKEMILGVGVGFSICKQ